MAAHYAAGPGFTISVRRSVVERLEIEMPQSSGADDEALEKIPKFSEYIWERGGGAIAFHCDFLFSI